MLAGFETDNHSNHELKWFDINLFQVFPDVFTKRELNGLCLHCSNQGCAWHGTYEALEVSWGGRKREGERPRKPLDRKLLTLIYIAATNEIKTIQLLMEPFLCYLGTFCCL